MMINIGDPAPEGFVPGMVPRTKEKNDEITRKRHQTNLERYGVEAPLQSAGIREKTKKTNLERYGVENPLQTEEARRNLIQGSLEKYGTVYPSQSEEIKEKMRQTSIERYGVDNPSKSEEIKEKIKQVNQERYGVNSAMQLPEIQEKAHNTCFEHYGAQNPLQSDEIMNKVKQTNLERYGVEHPMQSIEIQEKSRNTLLNNYGVDNPMKSEEIVERLKDTNIKRYGVEYTLQSEEVKEKVSQTCQEKYGVPWACMRPEARNYSNDSGPNKAFEELLINHGIPYEREYHISIYSYDFRVGDLLIEVNPSATHNIMWCPFGDHETRITEDYHQKKSFLAEQNGFCCIHIFDWDDPEKIIRSILIEREKVHARKCVISKVSKEDCTRFLMNNHLQGSCKEQSIRLGLYYKGELVSIMTFGKPRYNKNYQYELLRYCSSKSVIGGAQKIFKHFIREYLPESIISYCDRSKFRGDIYQKLEFVLKAKNIPSKHWYSYKENRHITDNMLRQKGYDLLFNESYGKGTSNEGLIIQRGYLPIFDCGQDTYVWINKT